MNKDYNDSMDLKAGARLLLKAIKNAEKTIDNENIEMVIVKKTGVKKITVKDLKKS